MSEAILLLVRWCSMKTGTTWRIEGTPNDGYGVPGFRIILRGPRDLVVQMRFGVPSFGMQQREQVGMLDQVAMSSVQQVCRHFDSAMSNLLDRDSVTRQNEGGGSTPTRGHHGVVCPACEGSGQLHNKEARMEMCFRCTGTGEQS